MSRSRNVQMTDLEPGLTGQKPASGLSSPTSPTATMTPLSDDVVSMSSQSPTSRPRTHEREGSDERSSTATSSEGFFHNSSITVAVPRDTGASHQVQRETAQDGSLAAPFAFAGDESHSCFAVNYLVRTARCVSHFAPGEPGSATVDQALFRHFQGGSTGSNPVGGAPVISQDIVDH